MPEPKPTKEAEAKLICGDCGKEVALGKPRSNITRFLFRESRCNCIQKDIVQAQGVLKEVLPSTSRTENLIDVVAPEKRSFEFRAAAALLPF